MPLINCPACEKQISTEANDCPHCGHPIKPKSSSTNSVIKVVIIIFIVLIGGFLLVCVGGPLLFYQVGQNVIEKLDQSKIENTKLQITQLESGLKLFKVDNGFYPDTQQGLYALIVMPTTGREPRRYDSSGYLDGDQIPLDQWGSEFIYIGPDQTGGTTYEIISPGQDRVPQTEDDISSKDIE